MTTEFTVDARSLTATGGNHVTARVLNPSGAKTDTYVTDNGDGTYRVQYTAYEEGKGFEREGVAHGPLRWARIGALLSSADSVPGFQVCIWWRCYTTMWPCPRAPSEWV